MSDAVITLTENEVWVARDVGSRRNAEAHLNGRRARFPERVPGELWGFHIESAHAELAVAKYLGIYWGFSVNTFHVPDIANTALEVRWSRRSDMKVRPDDTGIVVSVTGVCPVYRIAGWLPAEEAKREEWFFNQEPVCYFVPHADLNDPGLLATALWDMLYAKEN